MTRQDSLGLETPFDHLTALLCGQFGVPFGLVSFVHGSHAVFRSELGLGESSLPRDVSVSNLLVEMGPGAVLVVDDVEAQPVLKNHPMVVGAPFLKFFAGVTVSNSRGEPVGAVGIMDCKPRPPLTDKEVETLHRVAAIAGSMLDQVSAQREQAERDKLLSMAEQMSGVANWRYDVVSGKVTWSDEVYRIHGFEPGQIDPSYENVIGFYHPDDATVFTESVQRAIATGEGYDFRLRLRPPGRDERLVIAKATTEQDASGRTIALFGVFQDITDSEQAQALLAEREATYRLLADTATDVVARYDPTGKFLYVSPSARAVLGREPEEMLGKDCTGIIVEEDLAVIRETLKAYLAAGPDAPAPRYEYRVIMPEGGHIWLEATPRAIWDESGRLVEFHDCVRDVTARKALEREQAELVETLRMAEATAGLGHWRLDLATQQVTWSDEVYRIHGVDRATFDPSYDDAVGFYHPDDRQKVRDWIEAAIRSGKAAAYRLRIIRADGEERTVTSQCVPQTDDTGATTALFGVFQDITDIVRSHDQVAASEARYRLLANNATDIIATYGIDGVFRYISPAIEGPMGYRPEELIGRPFYEFMHPEDVAQVKAAFSAYFRAGADAEPPRIAYRGAPKGGGTVWLEAHPKLICDENGRPVEFQDVVRDITDTKRLEEALTEARDRAEEGGRAKSEFLANMSHELRTPLTSVIGFSGLLQKSQSLGPDERRYADRIATASEALLGVINDILDYSKLEADKVEMEPQPLDPRALATGAAVLVEAQCVAAGLDLSVEVDPAVPAGLMGDPVRLRQVLLNFLSNAVKFTKDGGIRVDLGGERMADGRWMLKVAVSDSGIGIPQDKLAEMFDRFTQADASTTRVYGGTGLGLAISRRLVEMMGGEIGVESRQGEGSTFWFTAPLAEAEAAEAPLAAADEGVMQQARILVADDAPANRELVTALLGGMGLAVEAVCDGSEAVEAARDGAYDLILMDVHMPVMDGLAATREIRSLDGPAARTPIVALTANVGAEQVQKCLEAGMDGHLSKPIRIPDLVAALTLWLTAADDDAAATLSA